MKERLPYVEIIGGANDNCPACTREVAHGDTLELGSIKISVIGTPCHTSGKVYSIALIDALLFGMQIPNVSD